MQSFIASYVPSIHYASTIEWEEVYKSTYNAQIHTKNQTYKDYAGDFYVCDVHFSNLGNDGVIFLNSSELRSLISRCTFDNSSNSKEGGSICITKGESSIRKVCSFGSQSWFGGFCYIDVSKNYSNINEIHDSSIIFSNREEKFGYTTISLEFGNISIICNNITKNCCQEYSTFGIGTIDGSVLIKYSINNDNHADYENFAITCNLLKYFSNVFINNTSLYYKLLSFNKCNATIKNCFFANNIHDGRYLFEFAASSIMIYNLYIDSKQICKTCQDITIISNKNVSLALGFSSTELCPGSNFFVPQYRRKEITDPAHFKDFKSLIKRKR